MIPKKSMLLEEWIALMVASGAWAFLFREACILWPGYAGGDEQIHAAKIFSGSFWQPFEWHALRGMIQSGTLTFLTRLFRNASWSWHLLGMACFALELAITYLLARRWWGRSAGAWAVVALALQAGTWLRVRSILNYQWVPGVFMLAMLLSTRVHRRQGALVLGAMLGAFTLDYDASALAAPFLLAACASQEPAFRRQWLWALGAWASVFALGLLVQADHGFAYASVRHSISIQGDDRATLLEVALKNWGQIVTGGKPRPYLAIQDWPFWAPWTWLGLGIGLWQVTRQKKWAWGAWAVLFSLVVLCSKSPHGLPSHRLYMATPAVILLCGYGFSRLTDGRSRSAVMVALLIFGLASESIAWAHHMALNRASTWDRGRNLEMASEWVVEHQGAGDAVLMEWAALHSQDLGIYFRKADPEGAKNAWFIAPLQLRRALKDGDWAESHVFWRSPASEPIWVLKLEGVSAARAREVDRALAELKGMPKEGARDRRWLDENSKKADPWLWASKLQAYGNSMVPDAHTVQEYHQWAILALRTTPGPMSWLAKTYDHSAPQYTAELCDEILALHPDYAPALMQKLNALERLGRPVEAATARQAWERAFSQGAWPIYDHP